MENDGGRERQRMRDRKAVTKTIHLQSHFSWSKPDNRCFQYELRENFSLRISDPAQYQIDVGLNIYPSDYLIPRISEMETDTKQRMLRLSPAIFWWDVVGDQSVGRTAESWGGANSTQQKIEERRDPAKVIDTYTFLFLFVSRSHPISDRTPPGFMQEVWIWELAQIAKKCIVQ